MVTFYSDDSANIRISWNQLILDINRVNTYNPYCKSDNYYQIFLHIIISILNEKNIVLLDSDFSDYEIERLIPQQNIKNHNEFLKQSIYIKNKNHLLSVLRKGFPEWRLGLFTSGTTGHPKKVTHSFENITRFSKISQKHDKDVWGFAYNPTHIAGVQVFFQALLNGNTIVRLFGLHKSDIEKNISTNQVSHISATPTFYNLTFSSTLNVFPTVVRITSGGEKLNLHLLSKLKNVFPKAKFTNVYASTEVGSLLASSNDVFTIKNSLQNHVKVINNELYVSSELTGDLIENIGGWYKTGDLVEIIDTNPLTFKFISRKNDLINVGGYNVYLYEVEEAILTIQGVRNAYVFAKKNSVVGNILHCNIVRDNNNLTEIDLRDQLSKVLQAHKVPRFFHFVESIDVTRTGKTMRQ